jgi:hypothetical protein
MKNLPLSLPADEFDRQSPFEEDKLGREALADRLTKYLDRLKSGAVIGINAPWGEGKTWFGRHWAKKLETDHKVIFIDAFESDYVEDPFLLIASKLSVLFDNSEGSGFNLRQKAARVMMAIVPIGTKAMINLFGRAVAGTTDLSADVDEAIKDASGATGDGVEKWIEKRIESLASERASLVAFRAALQEAAEKSPSPVVVFIDELDRCKPTFAVTLIERIKHLFDVPNLVFVLLLNRAQLEVAIAGQYGAGTDGQAYLGKFVNLWFDLPRARVGTQEHDSQVSEYAIRVLARYGIDSKQLAAANHFREDVVFWAKWFGLSLRDIDRMCALFVMADSAYAIPLSYLIALKVRYPNRFTAVRQGNSATHRQCSDELRRILESAEGAKLPEWEKTTLIGMSEMHQVLCGQISLEKSEVLKDRNAEIFGRSMDIARVFKRLTNAIDLPIESF